MTDRPPELETRKESNFFANFGAKGRYPIWMRYWKIAYWVDIAADLRIAIPLWFARRKARQMPPQRILIAAVEVPGRENDLKQVIKAMSQTSRHHVTVVIQSMQPVGKFDNIALAIKPYDMGDFDWLLVTDDDVRLPADFLDLLMFFALRCDLKFAQPAHRFVSYASARIIVRRFKSLVRRTQFVENGPVTLFHSSTFPEILPFPSLRWAWGIDVLWSAIAMRKGWRMGVIDGLSLKHWRPVGNSYNANAARLEAEEFLRREGVTLSRAEIFSVNERIA